jgi:hypothetical protein
MVRPPASCLRGRGYGRRQGGAGEVLGSFAPAPAPALADPAARGQPHLGGRQPIRIVRAARHYSPSGNCWQRSGVRRSMRSLHRPRGPEATGGHQPGSTDIVVSFSLTFPCRSTAASMRPRSCTCPIYAQTAAGPRIHAGRRVSGGGLENRRHVWDLSAAAMNRCIGGTPRSLTYAVLRAEVVRGTG